MPIIKYSVETIALSLLVITMLFDGTASAQSQIKNNNGITITEKGDVTVYFDEFTGKYAIAANDSTKLSSLNKDHEERGKSYIIPFFGGDIYDKNLTELTWTEKWTDDFIIVLIREEPENYFFEEKGSKQIPFLIEDKRLSKSASHLKRSSKEIIEITLNSAEWEKVINSGSSQFRISGHVFTIDQNTKSIMEQIQNQFQRIQNEKNVNSKEKEKVFVPKSSSYEFKSAPYDLKWEGDIGRSPTVQPLPSNTTGEETTIKIRFEVKPDGSVGRIIPKKKMNPELEEEVMSTLRDWRFSRLSSDVSQKSQWATITFHFVKE